MSELKDRIKAVRKGAGLKTQADFAQAMGTTRDAIATYEIGRVVPSDTFIQLLCTKFHINEAWLRTGEGDMMAASADNIFDEFARHYALTPEEKATARFLLRLSKDERAAILHYLKTWAAEITAAED